MSKMTLEQTISAPPERVWLALENFGDIYKFHPRVHRSPLVGERAGGLGAQRRCEFHDGNHVIEQIVGWEEGRSMTVDIVEGSMPLSCAQATITLHPEGDATRVTFEMGYEPKYGIVGKLMDVMMMRAQFRKILGEVLMGLDTHVRTGEVIGPEGPSAAA